MSEKKIIAIAFIGFQVSDDLLVKRFFFSSWLSIEGIKNLIKPTDPRLDRLVSYTAEENEELDKFILEFKRSFYFSKHSCFLFHLRSLSANN